VIGGMIPKIKYIAAYQTAPVSGANAMMKRLSKAG
jgi:hypothetical protein